MALKAGMTLTLTGDLRIWSDEDGQGRLSTGIELDSDTLEHVVDQWLRDNDGDDELRFVGRIRARVTLELISVTHPEGY